MMFGGFTATLWILLLKAWPTTTISIACMYKKDFSCCKMALQAHSIYQAIVSWRHLTHMAVHKRFHTVVTINTTLRFDWLLSNSEVSPRIWTCATRPSHAHMQRAGHETIRYQCLLQLSCHWQHGHRVMCVNWDKSWASCLWKAWELK